MALQTTDFGVRLKIRQASGQVEFAQHCLSIAFTRQFIIEKKEYIFKKITRIFDDSSDRIYLNNVQRQRRWKDIVQIAIILPLLDPVLKTTQKQVLHQKQGRSDKSQTYLKQVIIIRKFPSFDWLHCIDRKSVV